MQTVGSSASGRQEPEYHYATKEDGEASGPGGARLPYSLFHSTKECQGFTLLMLPGAGHTKVHFENRWWVDGLAAQGLHVLTMTET